MTRFTLPLPSLARPIAIVIGVQLLAGVVVGLIWLAWAPKTFAYVEAGAAGRTILIPGETEAQVAGDGRYLVLCAVTGVIAGVGAWQLRRSRGPAGLLALTVGALLGSLVARQIGVAFATGRSTGAVNTVVRTPLTLHASALLACQALVAAVLYVICAGLTNDQNLGVRPADPGGSGPQAMISPASSTM